MAFKIKNYAWAAAVTAAILAALYKDAWDGGASGRGGVLSASVQRSVSFNPGFSGARYGAGDEQRFGSAETNVLAFGSQASGGRPSILGPKGKPAY